MQRGPYIHQSRPSPFSIKGQTSVGLMCLNVDTSKKLYGPIMNQYEADLLEKF